MNYEQALEKKDAFLTYLDIERNVALNTYKSYQYDLNQIFTFWNQLQQQNTTHTYQMQEVVSKFFMHLHNSKVQKSSIARKVACLQSFVKYLHSCNISINLKLTAPRVRKKLPTYLTTDEINFLLDKLDDSAFASKRPKRDQALLEILYATGIRCAELANMKLGDINLDHKTILITGKGNKQRMVLFGNKAKEKLLCYLQTERMSDAQLTNNEHFFLSIKGLPLTNRTIQQILHDLVPHLPFKKALTPHKLRHSFATHLLHAGMNLRALQELLGHNSLATTELYTHITNKDLQELYQTINPMQLIKNSSL